MFKIIFCVQDHILLDAGRFWDGYFELKACLRITGIVEKFDLDIVSLPSQIQPTMFYRWQKEFFENGAAAFQQGGRPNHQPNRNESRIWRRRS
jgi:hypothetical protein